MILSRSRLIAASFSCNKSDIVLRKWFIIRSADTIPSTCSPVVGVWIGAAQSHLQALDHIQRKAMKAIGDQTLLPTLATRRLASALTYLYKLQCITGPAQLTSMVPPPALPTPHQRTRAQQADRLQYQLSCPLPVGSPDYLTRSFPNCVLSCWNSLPVNTIQQRPCLKRGQRFKTMVYNHFLHNNWVQSTDLC